MPPVRVRFAPAPSGDLHIGNVRTVLFNWLFARHHGGQFILRVEDTDAEKVKPEAIQQVMETLRWLGLNWDEGPDVGGPCGPYLQSQRLAVYRRHAERLLLQGTAYECFCSPEELEAARERARAERRPFLYPGTCRELGDAEREARRARGLRPAVRLKLPREGATEFRDRIRGTVRVEHAQLDDFVILRSDGTPTYNFAAVVDDVEMRISHVIRGDEHLANTPKQIHVHRALGAEPPEFAHVPMVLAPDRTKLSKRHGATPIAELRAMGYLAPAILNYAALLGWSADGTTEIMPLEEMIRRFDLDRVGAAAAVYDTNKLTWVNHQYIKTMKLNRLVRQVIPRLVEAGVMGPMTTLGEYRRVRRVVALVRERMHTLAEAPRLMGYFFTDEIEYDPDAVAKRLSAPGVERILGRAADALEAAEPWTTAAIEEAIRGTARAMEVKDSEVIHPVRVAVTGMAVGPGLFELLELVGRRRAVERLRRVAVRLAAGGLVAGARPATVRQS